jgi:hypothetical protein
MRREWRIGMAVVGLAGVFLLGWSVTGWLGRGARDERDMPGEGAGVTTSAGEPEKAPASRYFPVGAAVPLAGRLRVEGTGFGRGMGQGVERCYVNLGLDDPSGEIVAVQHWSVPGVAVDEAGRSMVPASAVENLGVEWDTLPGDGRGLWSGPGAPKSVPQVVLERLVGGGQKVKLMEGAVSGLMVTKRETIRLHLPGQDSREVGGLVVSVSFEPRVIGPQMTADGSTQVTVAFERAGDMTEEEWKRAEAVLRGTTIRMQMADGTAVRRAGGGGSSSNGDRVKRTLHVTFPEVRNGTPEAVVEVPAELKLVTLGYRFEGVELP